MASNIYKMPKPILNQKEVDELESLQRRYERLTKQSAFARAGQKVGDKARAIVPVAVKNAAEGAKEYLNEMDLIKDALKYAAEGFQTLEEYAARATVNEKTVLNKINKTLEGEDILKLEEVCFARSYDISNIVGNYKRSHVLTATLEGAATGAFSFQFVFIL